MGLPPTPPSNRYAAGSVYGFYMQNEGENLPINAIVASGNYVALLMPRDESVSEPYATSITFKQGGGIFVESRGQIVKLMRIAGTTGYLPSVAAPPKTATPSAAGNTYRGSLVDTSVDAEVARAAGSGFAAFHELRSLFRRFGKDRKEGKLNRLFFFNTKDDEYWEIEPQAFNLARSSRRPFLYDYEIQFTCIQVTEDPDQNFFGDFTSLVASAMIDLPGFVQQAQASAVPKSFKTTAFSGNLGDLLGNSLAFKPPYAASIRRFSQMAENGLGFLRVLSGFPKEAFQGLLGSLGSVVQVFDDVAATRKSILDVPVSILKQTQGFIASCFFAIDANSPAAVSADFEQVRLEMNEFLLEVQVLTDHMICGFDQFGDSYSLDSAAAVDDLSRTSLQATSPSALMPETGMPLAVNPFVGAIGVDAVIDVQKLISSDGYKTAPILSGETIYDVARRTLGSIHRFMELVIVNKLEFPYVVPSSTSKPFGTLAWGEAIKVPIQTNGRSASYAGPPETPATAFFGSVTDTGAATEVVSIGAEPPWRTDQWAGYTLVLQSGGGTVDPERIIVSNTEDTLVVNRAWSVSPGIGDTFSMALKEFKLGVAPSADAIAYGRDWLVKFTQNPNGTTNPYKATVLRNAAGDIATVSGVENFMQALQLRAGCRQGAHPFHPTYGFPDFVGRPFTPEIVPLYTFMARQSLLADSRVEAVTNANLVFSGTTLSFEAEVQPVNAQKSKSLFLGVSR